MAEPQQVMGVCCACKDAVLGGAINSHRFKNATERLEKLIEFILNKGFRPV